MSELKTYKQWLDDEAAECAIDRVITMQDAADIVADLYDVMGELKAAYRAATTTPPNLPLTRPLAQKARANMPEYISREAAKAACGCENAVKYGNETPGQRSKSYSTLMLYEVADAIDDVPAADVAPVVRCKDCDRRNKSADLANTVLCKWLHNITMNKTDFCSYGIIAKCSAQWESKNYQDEQDGQPFNMEFHVCTNCGKKVFFNFEKTDECPQCHARMDGGENHDQR